MDDNKIKLSIGDISFLIKWNGSNVIGWPQKIYKDFIPADDNITDVEINVFCGELPDCDKGDIVFNAGNNWKLYRNKDSFTIEEFDLLTQVRDRIIIMNKDLSSGNFYITPEIDSLLRKIYHKLWVKPSVNWSIHRLMDPFIKILTSNILIKRDSAMIHALGLSFGGKGVLFIGNSGTGKSTLANMLKNDKDITVFNDEKTIITNKDGDYFIHGTPWPGDSGISSALSAPLHKIFFIKHSPLNTISQLKPVHSVNCLLQQLFLPFWDRESLSIALKLCEKLVNKKEPYELGFTKDRSTILFVKDLIGT